MDVSFDVKQPVLLLFNNLMFNKIAWLGFQNVKKAQELCS